MTEQYPNVILIILDTLREDYSEPIWKVLRNYGFVRYPNVIAPSSWTIPSHASIITGVYPAIHGAHENKNKKEFNIRLRYYDLLTYTLKRAGYRTYLLSSNPYITPFFGFCGFDVFFDTFKERYYTLITLTERYKFRILKNKYKIKSNYQLIKYLIHEKEISLLLKLASDYLLRVLGISKVVGNKKWPLDKGSKYSFKILYNLLISRQSNIPKFTLVNLMEMHEPYFVNDPYSKILLDNLKGISINFSSPLVRKWREYYFKEAKYLASLFEMFLSKIIDKKAFKNSLIIVTSDHGQLLGEYNKIGHGTYLYDELIKVPLFVKYPDYCNSYSVTDVDEIFKNLYEQNLYFPLVMLRRFIEEYIKLNKPLDTFYRNLAFSESYGIATYGATPKNNIEYEYILKLEKYRIAIYYKNFKGIFNVTDWKFEEIISYNPKIEVTDDIVKHMKKEILKFLKTATVAKVPKIRI